jgi:hypothetical protein
VANTIGQFDYNVVKMKRGDSLPFNPHVELMLQRFGQNSDGFPIVSPHLMSEAEIDEHVQALKADLDSVSKRAKAALRKAKDATKALVASRSTE